MNEIQSMNIAVTSKCNLHCSYCYRNFTNQCNVLSFDGDEQKVQNNLESIKNSVISSVVLTGGEPLLYDALDQIIDLLHDKRITILTNGIKRCTCLDRIASVVVSFDGLENIMSLQRGINQQTYCKIRDNIEYYINKKVNVTLNSVITEQTIDCFEKIFDEFKNNCAYRLSVVSAPRAGGKCALSQKMLSVLVTKVQDVYAKYAYHIHLTHDIVTKSVFFKNYSFEFPIYYPPEYSLELDQYCYFRYRFSSLSDLQAQYVRCNKLLFQMLYEFLEDKDETYLFSPYELCERLLYSNFQ
jgi:MoaA/NifB/PqqE/SkfB family radical SAM enzyme